MKIENVKIETLIPYTFNNKIHTPEQIDRIANSIQQFGFNRPLVIDEKNVILVGHGGWQAAKKLGMTEVPVHRKTDLTETQKKAYRIIDNKTSSDTTYDLNNLELEVRALEELKFDATPFGFEEFKFKAEDVMTGDGTEDPDPDHKWVGQIKLKVSAEEIDSFEKDLDDLLKRYNGVTKETKRVK